MGAIIGLSGKSGSGKDYVADAIIADFPEYKFKKASFADELKKAAAFMLDLPIELFYTQEGKQTIIPWLGLTIREFLQKVGTDAIRNNIDVDFWVKKTRSKIKENDNLVFTDMRFINEMNMVHGVGGFCARVSRLATFKDWNKLSGLNIKSHSGSLPVSKEFYISESVDQITGNLEQTKKYEALIHTSELSLDDVFFKWYYTQETGGKPIHGKRISEHIFKYGYIPWEEGE